MFGEAIEPITKVISERRAYRRQWNMFESLFVVTLDIVLMIVSLTFSFYLAHFLRYNVLDGTDFLSATMSTITGERITQFHERRFSQSIPLITTFVFLSLVIFAIRGLYNLRLTGSWFRQMWTITTSTTISITWFMVYYFFFSYSNPLELTSRSLVLFIWLFTILIIGIERLVISGVMGILHRMGHGETHLLIVGSGRLGKLFIQHIASKPSLGYSIVGFLHDQNEPPGNFGRFKMLGTIDDNIQDVMRSVQVDEVIIALPAYMSQETSKYIKQCDRLGISFKIIPDLYDPGPSVPRSDSSFTRISALFQTVSAESQSQKQIPNIPLNTTKNPAK